MKKSVPGGVARLTAGCLPVPLFNQKKRIRQPFMSSPGAAADFVWETMKPEVPPLTKMMNTGQQSPSVPHLKQENGFSPDPLGVARSHQWNSWSYREDKAWDRNEFRPQRKSSCSVAGGGPGSSLVTLDQNQRQGQLDCAQAAGAQGPGSSGRSALQTVKRSCQQSQLQRKPLGHGPEEKITKKGPGCQLLLNKDDPSLRILPAVIESMKHWRELVPYPLLFEVLAVLDSAVTPGAQGAKTFLLRDGKNTVPCVFYEIDRELPRLIRGRVHRCVGSYDPKRDLFKCVSVRPAAASEQKTFLEFVRVADARMSYYASAVNEM